MVIPRVAMSKKGKLLTKLVVAGGLALFSPVALSWQVTINGTANSFDDVHAVAVDPAGDVVAAGSTRNTGSFDDFTVVKLSGTTGAELWRREINGDSNGPDQARAVALDPAGDVIAAGFTRGIALGLEFTVVKLAGSTGAVLWRKVVNGTARPFDWANAVAVDDAGDVFAAGLIENTGSASDFAVVKLSGKTGDELWRQDIDGSANWFDRANAVSVDGAGDVVAVGRIRNVETSDDLMVIKLSGATGTELWRQEIDAVRDLFDEAFSVAVDTSLNVVAAGHLRRNFFAVKLSGDSGAELWRSSGYGLGEARAVSLDAVGDIFAAGWIANPTTGFDFTVVKLSGDTGGELWRQDTNGSANGFDGALAARADAAGDVVAAGWVENTDTSSDFTLIKLSGTDGNEVWRREIDGTASRCDAAVAIALDAEGHVAAAGRIWNAGTEFDFTVVKLNGTDGSDF